MMKNDCETFKLRLLFSGAAGFFYSFGAFDLELWRHCEVVTDVLFLLFEHKDTRQALLTVQTKKKH